MKLIDHSLRNSTAVIVGMILTVLFGYLAFKRIPIQLNPTIETPFITVETDYPGASASEVEQEVTRRQEEKLAAVENLREMRSTSSEGRSSITLKFDWGVNKDLAGLDVLKKLNLVEDLPDDAEEPQILTVNRHEEETVMWLSLETKLDVNEQRRVSDDLIVPQLERVEGVGAVRRYGGEEREIHVCLDLDAVAARQVTFDDISQALARENCNVRGGSIDQGMRRVIVRTVGQFANLDEIRQTVVKRTEAGVVRVRDIATVEDSTKEINAIVRVNGQPTIAMGVVKKTGTNTLEVAEHIKAEIAKLNKSLEPRGVKIAKAYDASEYIWDSIYQVRSSMILGGLLAVVVLWTFLRSWISTFIVSITIPVCMVGTFALLAAFDRSVNVVSLAGLGFASGMIVDNGIVVVENIYRHRVELGKSILVAARDAAGEVWAPIVASTLTTLAVFLPILFIKEEAGQLFRDIAYSISFAVALSMVTAVTVVPMLASRLMGRLQPGGVKDEHKGWVRRRIDPVLEGVGRGGLLLFYSLVQHGLRRRWFRYGSIALIVAGFVLTLLLVPPAEYLPTGNQNFVIGVLKLPAGMSLEGSQDLMMPMEEQVRSLPELERTFFVILRDSPLFGMIIKKENADKGTIQRIVQSLTGFAMGRYPFPDIIPIIFQRPVFSRGLNGGKGVSIDIRGPSLDKLQSLTDQVSGQVRAIPGVLQVRPQLDLSNPELQIYPDRERLADLGLTGNSVATAVETLVEGRIVSLYRDDGKEYDLKLKGLEDQIRGSQSLAGVEVDLPGRGKVKLADVSRIERRLGPVSIERMEQERVSTLNVTVDEATPLEAVIDQINEDVVAPMVPSLPFQYQITLSGSADDLACTILALKDSFILALIIIYLLMSALFRSFIYPLIIMFSVPLAMSGAFMGIRLGHVEYNVITMLGFILLAGVVVNNAILLVDVSLNLVREGATHKHAVMEGVRRRIRPVFMTSATSVLGMLPLAMGEGSGAELYNGLGMAVVGGLTCSTLFTLILIPLLLFMVLEARDKLAARMGRPDFTEVARARALAELDDKLS